VGSLQAQVSGALDLWPRNSSVELGSTKQFGAYVPLNPSTVTWLVNDVPGGNATVGTISSTGLYQPPQLAPTNNQRIIKVQSTAFSTSFAATSLKGTRKYPCLWSASPVSGGTFQVGTFQASLNGSNFTPDSQVTANGVDLATTYVSPTKVTATGTAGVGTLTFTVRQPGPGAVTGNTVSVQVAAATVAVSLTPSTTTVQLGANQSFSATVTGHANTAVTWSVGGVIGGSAAEGLITSSGVYTAPAAMPASTSVIVRATSVANPATSAQTTVTLILPPSSIATLSAARFLEQSSFGPTPISLAEVQQLGIPAYLEQQFALPATAFPMPVGNSVQNLQRWILHHYTVAPDQLRQRVLYALSQIVVTSTSKLVYADEMLPWLSALRQHTFGNYRDLLRDVTKSSSMGKFLDLANSMKLGQGGGANENYPRELLQLFALGLWQLNPDGSQVLDGNTNAIPTYTQNDVTELALALTGRTYATAPGVTSSSANHEYHGAPMEARPQNHDITAKNVLGQTIPAGQTVEPDLESVLEILMNHPNTAPFIATRLIRSLVFSNPSDAYIERVASVFTATDGDLPAVVTAILTDVEARDDLATVNSGRLKEPILPVAGFLRALNGQFTSTQQLTYLFSYMAQIPLGPPSVFSWFSPLYRVPKSPLFGPEFQIYTPTEATLRGNLLYYLLSNPGSDFSLDLSPFQPYGNDLPGLVEAVNQRLLYGRMPAGFKQVLITAATPGYDAKTRIETVLYLTALSGQYTVQF